MVESFLIETSPNAVEGNEIYHEDFGCSAGGYDLVISRVGTEYQLTFRGTQTGRPDEKLDITKHSLIKLLDEVYRTR